MKAPDLQEKLQESEKLIEEMSKTWEEKLQETERIHKVRKPSEFPTSYNSALITDFNGWCTVGVWWDLAVRLSTVY